MTSFVAHTTVDCRHAYELSEWWKSLLGYVDIDGDPNEPGHEECMIRDPESGHRILFIEVPDEDLPAKRIHFDVRPRDGRRATRRSSGCSPWVRVQVGDQRGKYGPGTGWVVFADPEGNQFCMLRSLDEVHADPPAPEA